MARSIAQIKSQICETFISQEAVRTGYGLKEGRSFDKAFSPVSLESLMFYVVASCIWLLEKLFDRHREEVDARIDAMRPHTLRWYATKAKEYMRGKDLIMADGVVVADCYDTSGMTEEDIEKARVVKYAVATEDSTQVYIKVAGRGNNGQPRQLDAEVLAGLNSYISQIKDAGVAVRILNEPADNMRIELVILYDPAILTALPQGAPDADGYTPVQLLHDSEDVITGEVNRVISELPFNGEYRNSDLMAAIQSVEGVKVVDIVKVEAAAGGSEAYSQVVGYRRPYSGYYALKSLTVKGRPYQNSATD